MIDSVIRGGLRLLSWPSQKVVLVLAAWLATVSRWLNTGAAQVTRTNLQACFPELSPPARDELCRLSLTHMSLMFFELAQLAYWPEEKLLGQIQRVRGKDLLDHAYHSGGGVLLLVPHFGNWELLCAYLGAHYDFAALYDRPKIGRFENIILGARQRFRGELFAIDTAGMRHMLRAFKQGKLIAILPDQVPDRSAGVYADFFAQPALTMTLPHRLIKKNQPAVLIGSVERVPVDGSFAYEICFESLPQALYDSDPAISTTVMNKSIEQVVQRAPAQYQWEYKRFKRPPQQGVGNIYRRQ